MRSPDGRRLRYRGPEVFRPHLSTSLASIIHNLRLVDIRQIATGQPLTLPYKLRALYPVRAKTPATRVYQYYSPDVNDVAPPADLTIY